MNIKPLLPAVLLLAVGGVFAGEFALTNNALQNKITYNGQDLVEKISSKVLAQGEFTPDAKKSFTPGISNIWSENPASLFRQEVALAADKKSVEISFLAYNDAFQRHPGKTLEIVLPYSFFEGAEYEGLHTNGRFWKTCQGKLTAQTPNGAIDRRLFRFFTIKKGDTKLIFDFNVQGPADYFSSWRQYTIRAIWDVRRAGDKLIMRMQTSLPSSGGFVGAKLRIYEGGFADYHKLHAWKAFHYNSQLRPKNLFSFGAKNTGKVYTHADLQLFNQQNKAGWLDNSNLKSHINSPNGAYYSNVSGKDKTFRISDLTPGIHIVTVTAGNYGNLPNKFAVSLNGQPMNKGDVTVPDKHATTLTQAIWVDKGTLDIKFAGNFIVSAISTQFLLASTEDFSFRRSFWVSSGFEVSPVYRNDFWVKAADTFPAWAETVFMPEPGKETSGVRKTAEAPVELPDLNSPAMRWRYSSNMIQFGGYSRSEWWDEEKLQTKLDSFRKQGVKAFMSGGLLSRHTYMFAKKKNTENFAKLIKQAHKADLKVIDHHDATLLWNIDHGFRVMAERLGQTERDWETNLPNTRFCIMNKEFNAIYVEYCKELVKLGVDGFQIDEAYFFSRGCVCADCRRQFHADTNWYLPLNELDPAWKNLNSPLRKAWFEWKRTQEANWMVNLRRKLKDLNPDLCFSQYTTHWGFTMSLPRTNITRDMEEYARAVDYFGTEVMTRNPIASGRPLVPYRKAFNLLNFAYGAPIWAIYYNNHPDIRSFCYALSNMTKQQALIAYMPVPPGKQDFQSFVSNPDNMDKTQAVEQTKIALLFSRSSRDWNSGVGFEPELFGLAQTLEEMHTPYTIIGEVSLKPDVLKQFKVLAIGTSGCLSDEQIKVIKEFAFNGGTVLLSNIAGTFDPLGNRRKVWAFADVLKFSPRITPAKNIKELTDSQGNKVVMARAVTYYEPKPLYRGKSQVYAKVGKNNLPVFIEKSYGKGKFIYNPMQMTGNLYAREGAVGKKWYFKRDDALAKLMHNVLAQQLKGARVWQTDAPEKVYTTIYAEKERMLIHFLNGLGTNNLAYGEVMTDKIKGDPFPAITRDITFTLEKPLFAIGKVYAVSPDFKGRKELKSQTLADGSVKAVLPKELLKIYTIVILEKAR